MAETVRGQYERRHLDLVERQIALWHAGADDGGALADWADDGVLIAPRGITVARSELLATIEGWHREFRDLRIDPTSLFVSGDGTWMGIEWTWNVTRRSDGASSQMFDAIVVELRDDLIVRWCEYFDTFGSVEFE